MSPRPLSVVRVRHVTGGVGGGGSTSPHHIAVVWKREHFLSPVATLVITYSVTLHLEWPD